MNHHDHSEPHGRHGATENIHSHVPFGAVSSTRRHPSHHHHHHHHHHHEPIPQAQPRPDYSISISDASSGRQSGSSGPSFDLADHHHHRIAHHETKPRLSKEQQDILERHFQKQPKPTTQVKKGFAENLNVPLDKINNWFQNRRAKVKQDAKKREGAFNALYAHQSSAVHPTVDAAYIDHAFYQTLPAAQPMLHPASASMPWIVPEPLLSNEQAFIPQPYDLYSSLPGQYVTSEPSFADNEDAMKAFFGLPISNVQTQDCISTEFWDFSKQFSTATEQFNAFSTGPINDQEIYNHSFGNVSRDNSLTNIDSVAGEEVGLGIVAGPNGEPLLSLSYLNQDYDDRQESLSSWRSASHSALAMHGVESDADMVTEPSLFPNAHIDAFPTRPTAEKKRRASVLAEEALSPKSIVLPSQAMDEDHNDIQSPIKQDEPFLEEDNMQPEEQVIIIKKSPPRRDSVVSRLADSMDNVEMHHSASNSSNSNALIDNTKTGPISNLAARRHARRPAQLGSGTTRSLSYQNPPPSSSPRTASFPEKNLRRIKSSIGGSGAGRIQKSGASSAQRSPICPTFASDALVGSKFSRRLSAQSSTALTNDSAARSVSEAGPLTPSSPVDHAQKFASVNFRHAAHISIPEHDLEEESGDGINDINMTSDSDEKQSHHWASVPMTMESGPSYASPPRTPMDGQILQQTAGYHNAIPDEMVLVPHSAPAWQQTFSIPSAGLAPELFEPGSAMPTVSASSVFRPATAGESLNVESLPQRQRSFAVPGLPGYNPAMGGVALGAPQPCLPGGGEAHQPHPPGPHHHHHHHLLPQGHMAYPGQPLAFSPFATPHPFVFPMGPAGSMPAEFHNSFSVTGPPTFCRTPSALQTPTKPQSELFIHEWCPKEPADITRLPPKPPKPQGPKEYIFTNHGPEYFSSP